MDEDRVLRICILTETYQPEVGGGETQARLLAEGLHARGHSAHVLTRWSNAATARSERLGVVPVTRLRPAGRGQLKKWGLLLTTIPWLVAHRRRYDVIFVSGFRIIGVAALLVGKLLGKVCILKADSQGEMSGAFFGPGLRRLGLSPGWWFVRLFLRLRNGLLRRADAFAAISEETAEELAEHGVPTSKLRRIPNGVDTVRFAPADAARKGSLRVKLGLPPDVPVAVYTGRLVSYKGLPLLLEVWREVHVRQQRPAQLVLVGTGGLDIHNCEAQLREYVSANDLARSVTFTGSVLNVEEYLQAADLFVFPTENDAMPSSLVEAMACGLPVISTPVGAISTIVAHEQNGLLIEAANGQALSQALHRLLADRDLSGRLGQAARKTIEDNYSADSVTRAYLALFQELLPAKPSAARLLAPRGHEPHE